jgi:hypothetical protein
MRKYGFTLHRQSNALGVRKAAHCNSNKLLITFDRHESCRSIGDNHDTATSRQTLRLADRILSANRKVCREVAVSLIGGDGAGDGAGAG